MLQEDKQHKRNLAALDAILAGRKAGASKEQIAQRVREATAKIQPESVNKVIPKKMEIGERIEGEGIYLGIYKPKDRDGQSLAKTFNVFAAPEDLPAAMTYVDAVKYVAGLKDWHGHDGEYYTTAQQIYNALKDGSYG